MPEEANVPTKKWKYLFSVTRQCVTANKRVATIGGANAHSRRDRLSFVKSFTLSNDTHCFWTRSYASRPCTWHRLHALLFPFFSALDSYFASLSAVFPSPPPSLQHRFAAIIVFPASFSTVLVPSRRLNSIC